MADPEDVPSWLGGALSAERVMSRANLMLDVDADGEPTAAAASDVAALRACLGMLERGEAASRRCGIHRRTIWTSTPLVRRGEPVRVVHVYEAFAPPAGRAATLYRMGPKAVLGEYVDGELVAVSARDETEARGALLDEAREVFDACDRGRTGELGLEALRKALALLSLDGLICPEGESCGADEGGGGGGGEGGGEGGGAASAVRDILRGLVGGENVGAPSFLRLAANLLGGGDYDGAVDAAPGVDANWRVTRHAFDEIGEHVISWHGLEHFAGVAASNELRIRVVSDE